MPSWLLPSCRTEVGSVPCCFCRGAHISLQIACALSYLHSSMGLLHLDIKPGNVLLTKTGDAKLSDVGFSRTVNRDSHSNESSEAVGTFDFCAPEVLLGEEADEKADIWR